MLRLRVYKCVCVCVSKCICEGERGRERENSWIHPFGDVSGWLMKTRSMMTPATAVTMIPSYALK